MNRRCIYTKEVIASLVETMEFEDRAILDMPRFLKMLESMPEEVSYDFVVGIHWFIAALDKFYNLKPRIEYADLAITALHVLWLDLQEHKFPDELEINQE